MLRMAAVAKAQTSFELGFTMTEIRNVDQLRQAIDLGHTGDKIDFPDPATAPLGTDAEAGGVSPSAAEIAQDIASTPPRQADPAQGNLGFYLYLYLAAIAVLIGLVFVIIGIAR